MMTSPKERVRANIYKELLEQEKRRNKKLSIVSVSVFLLEYLQAQGIMLYIKQVQEDKAQAMSWEPKNKSKNLKKIVLSWTPSITQEYCMKKQ